VVDRCGCPSLIARSAARGVCRLARPVCRLARPLCRLARPLCTLAAAVCRLAAVVCRLAAAVCRLAPVPAIPAAGTTAARVTTRGSRAGVAAPGG